MFYLPSLSPKIRYFSSIKKFSVWIESGLVSDSDGNGEVDVLKSNDETLVGPIDSGDVGGHKSVPLVSDSSRFESTKTIDISEKYIS